MTASISRTARIGDDIAAQMTAELAKESGSVFPSGVTFTPVFDYALTADTSKNDTALHVGIHPGEIDAKRASQGTIVGITTLVIAVRLWSGTTDEDGNNAPSDWQTNQRTLFDGPMALVDALCGGTGSWLFKATDTHGNVTVRKFDGNATCVTAKAVMGDDMDQHLWDLGEFFVPIICEFKAFD
jgi:hypothetical protein